MSNPERILQQLRTRPVEMRFADVRTLLIARGWELRDGGKGSHIVATSPLGRSVTIAQKHQRVKRYILDQIRREIERCEGG